MNKSLFDLKFYKAGLFLFVILICYYVVMQLIYPYVGHDGGYYLSVGRDIYEGRITFYTTAVQYNPLGMYILGLPYAFNMDNPIIVAYLIYFLIHLLNAYIFFKIIKTHVRNKRIIILSVVLFLLFSFFYGGVYIYLEPIELLFLLLMSYSLLKNRLLLTGLFLFLAFYTKQYAIAASLAIFIYLIIENKNIRVVKKLGKVAIGFSLALLTAYFLHRNQISFQNFIFRLLGQTEFIEGTLRPSSTGLYFLFKNTVLFVSFSALVIYGLVYYFPKLKNNSIVIFYIIGFFSLSLSLYISSYNHYFIQIFPWGLIIFSIGLDQVKLAKWATIFLSYAYLITILLFSAVLVRSLIYNLPKKRYTELMKECEIIEEHVPKRSEVFLRIDPSLYVYLNYYSANFNKLSYRFPKTIELKHALNYMHKQSYIIFKNKEYFENIDLVDDRFMLISKNENYHYFIKNTTIQD